ncbi:sorbitol dehydrogenase-like [Liolophura sinensis]|uniref:sorbitol dehydrogenase-like n=1 Tax=Liolophura sinensis TaxID=3198878 RepID=UPI0031584AFC
MSDTNLSAVLYKKDDLRLEDRPIPQPAAGEVQVCMHSVGICGSDVRYWVAGGSGRFVVREPLLMGHECSGIVSQVGDGVTSLKVGDRVAIEPGVPCRRCDFCKTGRYNLCQDVFFLATPPDNGALARYHTHAADFCYKLPDNLSMVEGALLEPLSVGIHACRRGEVTLGHRVLVCGAGPIGLCVMLAAKALGVAATCVTDIDSKRLEFAKKIGATSTLLVDSKDPAEVSQRAIAGLGGRPDVTVDCSGAEISIQLGVAATKPGGILVLVGHCHSASVPASDFISRELEMRATFRYVNTWKTAVDMVSSGKVDVKPLVTHHFPLEKTLDAFEAAKTGAGIKVIIDCFRS